jgi:hypothetical protein
MNNCFIVDVSFPDDVFFINIKVEGLNKNIFQLSYATDNQFIGLFEVDKSFFASRLTGNVRLSDFQLKLLHEGITGKMELRQKKAVSKIW